MDRHRIYGLGLDESLERCKCALQIVQAAAGDELVVKAQSRRGCAAVEIQVCVQNVLGGNARFRGNHLRKLVLLFALFAEKRKHVHLCIEFVTLVDLAVHVDREVGNDHKVAVDIDQLGLNSFLGPDDHSSGHGERSVEPRRADHSAVSLNIQFYVLFINRDLCVRLDLEHRRIAVAGHHLESLVVSLRNTKRDDRGIVSGDKIPLPGFQFPWCPFEQPSHPCLL